MSAKKSTTDGVNEPIKIGFGLPLTGGYAAFGEEFKRGAELAGKEMNGNKESVVLIIEDTKELSSKEAVTITQKLVNIDKVDAVVMSAAVEASSSHTISNEANIPMLVMWDSNQQLNDMGDKVFAIGPWTPASAEVSAEYSYKNIGKKAAVFGYNQEWSAKVSEVFVKRFSEIGGQVTYSELVNPGLKDYRSTIQKIITSNPDVIYMTIDGFTTGLQQLKDLGYKGKVVTSDILDNPLIVANPDIYEGVYGSQVADPQGDEYITYAKKYKEMYGKDPEKPVIGAWVYDSVKLLYEAKKKQGDFIQNIYATDYSGASGKIKFDSEGASKTIPKMYIVKKQQIVPAE